MKKTNKSKDAFVLLIALAFVSLLALGSTFLLRVSLQKAHTEKKRVYTEMARIIAESGVHISVSAIQRDATSLVSGFDPIEIGEGTATVVINESDISGDVTLSSTESSEKYYVLTSTGRWNDQLKKVGVLLRSTTAAGVDPEVKELFDGAVFCGGKLTMHNNSFIDLGGSGTIHVNGELEMKNGSLLSNGAEVTCHSSLQMFNDSEIYADVYVPVDRRGSSDKGEIYGTLYTEDVPEQYIYIDLEPYKTHAIANGSYFEGDFDTNNKSIQDEFCAEDGSITPEGGVLWVAGNVYLKKGSPFNGCIIATGNIELNNSSSVISPGNGYPALVSVSGDIRLKNSGAVTGLIYTKQGNVTIDNSGSVTGAFISNGNLEIKNSGSIVYDNSSPVGPNGENVMGPESDGALGGIEIVRWLW